MPVTQFMYILDCGDVTLAPKWSGTEFACMTHKRVVQVIDVLTAEWHARCEQPKCPFSVWTGQDSETAQVLINRHVANTRHMTNSVAYQHRPEALAERRRLLDNGFIILPQS